MYDVVIIGGSAAGLTAGIYASRRRLKFKIITGDLGGEVATSGIVENWPGEQSISGFDLAQKIIAHAKSYEMEIEERLRVTAIEKIDGIFKVTAENGSGVAQVTEAKAVIVTSGIHPRLLGVPGEKDYLHKGITYCTICDGPLFKNKITATVGSGNSALESAIMMAGIAKKVFLISNKPNDAANKGGFPKGEDILVEKVKGMANVEIIYSASTTEITGNGKVVTGLKYKDANGEEKTIETQGVMVHIGNIPNSDFVTCASKNPLGNIVVNVRAETDCPGLFAAGDVTDTPHKQAIIAAGQGATAILSVTEYLNRLVN
ncbi:MAG: FAD-dependent oxidoreductase [bacterium]|nr:FAD-dependent oxidoreductase [bacterium]